MVEYLSLACEDFLFLLPFPDRAAPFWAEIARVIAEKSALLTWDAAVKPDFVVDHIILSNCPERIAVKLFSSSLAFMSYFCH